MTGLESNLREILSQKEEKIIPENIKKDVTIFGVTGILESGGSSDYNARLVPTNGRIISYITEISAQLDTSSVTNMSYMFNNCTNLTAIPLLDTSSVTNMQSMFQNCTNLTTIPQLDTSNVTDMSNMFNNCPNLQTIPQLATSSVTNMQSIFYGCTNLTTIPLLDTSSVTSMQYMFRNCTNLTTIPQLDTSSVTSMYGTFRDCTNLTTIPSLDISSVTSIQNMFYNCTSLSDESLNNILAMCSNATSYTSTKTLAYIGLTSEQANKCKTLSNYSAFTSAGWTTGY